MDRWQTLSVQLFKMHPVKVTQEEMELGVIIRKEK